MQGQRLYGEHITVAGFKVQEADGSWPTNFTSLVNDIESIDIDPRTNTEDAKALKDYAEYPLPTGSSYQITITLFGQATTAGGTEAANVFLFAWANRRAIQFQIAYDDPRATHKGDLYSGQAIVMGAPVEIRTGPIRYRVTLLGQGPLTIQSTS